MMSGDIFDLLSLTMNNENLGKVGAGQYLNNYVDPESIFPAHVMKELEIIRN